MVTNSEQADLNVHLSLIILPHPWSCLPEMRTAGKDCSAVPGQACMWGKKQQGMAVKEDNQESTPEAAFITSLPPSKNVIRVAQKEQEVRTVTSQTASHPFSVLSISSCLIKTYSPSYGRGAFRGLECNHWDTLISPQLSWRQEYEATYLLKKVFPTFAFSFSSSCK